jgi:hypothetical protein
MNARSRSSRLETEVRSVDTLLVLVVGLFISLLTVVDLVA